VAVEKCVGGSACSEMDVPPPRRLNATQPSNYMANTAKGKGSASDEMSGAF